MTSCLILIGLVYIQTLLGISTYFSFSGLESSIPWLHSITISVHTYKSDRFRIPILVSVTTRNYGHTLVVLRIHRGIQDFPIHNFTNSSWYSFQDFITLRKIMTRKPSQGYRISLVIRWRLFLPKTTPKSRSISEDGSRSLGLFWKCKIRIVAKFHSTD